jgi:hypothetical protein
LYISTTTADGSYIPDYIGTWASSTNTSLKGFLIFQNNSSGTTSVFQVTSASVGAGIAFYTIGVIYYSGTLPANGNRVVISHARTGDIGTAGTTGATGSAGATGPSGANGTIGVDGITGATGPTGPSGASGLNGLTGATGPADLTVVETTGTSLDFGSSPLSTWNKYYYLTNTGFNAITLPGTTSTITGGKFWCLRNATPATLSITLTNTLSLTNPLVIPPANSLTLVISGVSNNTILLF